MNEVTQGFGINYSDARVVKYERPSAPFDSISRRLITRTHTPDVALYHVSVSACEYAATHSETLIFYGLTGRGSITVGGSTFSFGPGDAVLVPKDTELRHVAEEDQTLLIFWSPAPVDGRHEHH
jgi:quercetin dioxygenase-like cupin family protein